MTTNTLSHLSKGYGSWTAGHVNPYFGDSKHGHHELPEIIEPDSHFHGVTVGSRSGRSTAMSYASPRKHRDHREPINDQIPLSKSYTVNSDRAPLPKTYTTRKGALQIYVAPGDMEADEPGYELRPKYVQVKRPHGKELIDLSLKLGTIERLAMSVLQFGDEDYDHEHSSVTDDKNKAFLKFLRSVDEGEKREPEVDRTVQPGGDLHNYLRDLRSSASGRYGEGGTHLSKHHEARELQAILRGLDANSGWPLSYSQDGMSDRQSSGQFTRPVSRVSSRGPSPVYWRKLWLHRPPSTPRSSYRVLSARKVAASIKSGTYLGRPGSRVSTNDDDVTPSDLRTSSPPQVTAATTSNLKQQWTPTDSTDKRATRNANANARKGEGQNVPEVKVTGKSDAGSQGKGQGQKMAQIAEEHGDGAVLGPSALYDDYDADDDDDDYFARRAAEAERLARANADGADRQGILLGRSGVINIDIEGQLKRLGSRPGSGLSDSSGSSYTSTHTPSIITIQNLKRAQKAQQRLANEKFSSPRKRRPISHEHERSKARVQSSHGDRHSSKLVQDETFDGAIGISIAAPTPENTNGGQFAYGGNMTWNMDEAIPAEISDDAEQYVDNKPPEFESANNELDLDGAREESSDYEGQGQIDNLVTDQDEYDAEHLQECNDEIKQIEAKVEAAIAESDNGNYRDSSLLDEEAIKVIQESQNQGESQGQARSGPGSIKSRMSGIGKESIIEDNSEVRSEVSRSEVSRSEVGSKMSKPSLTRQSAIDLDTDGDLDEKVEGQIAEETEFEVTEQEKEDEQGGGVSRADLESQQGPRDGDWSGDSAGVVLPALDSDKLPANKQKNAHDIVKELDALGLNKPVDKKKKKKDGSSGLTYPLAPPGKRPQAPPEQAKIPDHIVEALNRQPVESILKLEEDLERMTDMVGESLSGHTLEAIGEGLTEEELQLAKQLLQQKIDEAKGKLDNKEPGTDTGAKSAIGGKKKATGGGKGAASGGKTGKGGKGKRKGKQTEPERTQEDIDREAIRLKHEEEKRIRDEESAELQRKIAEKRALLQAQNDANSVESKKLREKMLELEKEADNLMQAEDEARSILAGVHKQKREEREARRKADLEKKKRDAHDRRERERKELEEKRKKEEEMLEKIADGEMRRQAREEEERKAEEEERMAQERYEAELRDAARHEEEEEERLKDIERAAEEEAMQKLIEEREAAERERRMLREEAEQRMEEERLETERIIEEQMSLERERQRLLEIENAKREQQRLNLIELRRLEEEARAKMQEEIAKRRADALARRDINLENRMHVDKLKHYQGITRAWTFSYFVHWPRETYERRMGADPKKKRPRFPPKKKTAEPGAEQVAGSEQDKEAAAPNAQSAPAPAQSQ